MALDTLDTLIGKVQQRVGLTPDYFLVRDWILAGYRDVMNRIPWSWRRKKSQLVAYAPYSTGTVSIIRGENIARFAGGAVLTANHIGQQLRAGGNNYGIRTILGLVDAQTANLDDIWGADNVTAVTFEIYKCYFPMPSDFDSFISIVDLVRNFQLDYWNHNADELDRTDPMRSYGGNIAYWMVLKDYASQLNGQVSAITQSKGTGSKPLSGGNYTGAVDSTFTIEMTSATVFKWKRDETAAIAGVAIDSTGAGNPIPLQDGVQIAFPATGVYVNGDLFTIRCTAVYGPDLLRYEPWPHIKANEERPYLYLAKLADLDDPGATLPRYCRGDVLVELALAACARWADKNNAYFNLKLAMLHDDRAEAMLLDMEREDQAREVTDLVYDTYTSMPVYDSGFLAGHDIGYELNTL